MKDYVNVWFNWCFIAFISLFFVLVLTSGFDDINSKIQFSFVLSFTTSPIPIIFYFLEDNL